MHSLRRENSNETYTRQMDSDTRGTSTVLSLLFSDTPTGALGGYAGNATRSFHFPGKNLREELFHTTDDEDLPRVIMHIIAFLQGNICW